MTITYRYAHKALIRCILDGDKRLEVKFDLTGFDRVVVNGRETITPSALVEAFYGRSSDELERSLLNYAILIPNSDALIRDLITGETSQWDLIEFTGAHVRVVRQILSRVVDERLTEVTLKRNELVVRKELPDGDIAYIYLRDQGDGVEKFLAAALWLEAIKPRVVLWDDLEASAHPSLIEAALQWLNEHDGQVVASTVNMAPSDASIIVLRKTLTTCYATRPTLSMRWQT